MNPSAFRAFTFDCYGTLIDWEQGMLRALRALLAIDADDEALLSPPSPGTSTPSRKRTRR